MTPNPGSKEAIEAGCTCPVLDNCHGEGLPYPEGVCYWYTEGCPVHEIEEEEDES